MRRFKSYALAVALALFLLTFDFRPPPPPLTAERVGGSVCCSACTESFQALEKWSKALKKWGGDVDRSIRDLTAFRTSTLQLMRKSNKVDTDEAKLILKIADKQDRIVEFLTRVEERVTDIENRRF